MSTSYRLLRETLCLFEPVASSSLKSSLLRTILPSSTQVFTTNHWAKLRDATCQRHHSTSSAHPDTLSVTGEQSWNLKAKEMSAGQPTPATHPHLLMQGEITPGVTAAEYAARRQRLMEALPPYSLVVLPAANTLYMSGVIPYPYRQDADFFYLTGLQQRGVLVLQTGAGQVKWCFYTSMYSHPLLDRLKVEQRDESVAACYRAEECAFTLFIEPPNDERARWDGATVCSRAAQEVFRADDVLHFDQMPRRLQEMTLRSQEVFFDTDRTNAHQHSVIQSAIMSAMSSETFRRRKAARASSPAQTLQHQQAFGTHVGPNPLRPLMHAMRLRKSASEVGMMRKTARLAGSAIRDCMSISQPGIREHALAATFEYECKRQGASRMAFPPVVAGGPDACTIHYGRNDKVVLDGQLVLMDAGCELHGYCSDVTRTWPVNGRFTPPQRDVYEAVLDVHRQCVAACKPGSSLRELHALSIRLMSQALIDLGVVGRCSFGHVSQSLYRDFYWHSLGHWLGLDTHDTHLMAHDRALQAGHVITIEPGLYIPDQERFGHLRGIGVRIEDDVLVTEDGCEILSNNVPHKPGDIEDLVRSGLRS